LQWQSDFRRTEGSAAALAALAHKDASRLIIF
jgi:hypothetical protein